MGVINASQPPPGKPIANAGFKGLVIGAVLGGSIGVLVGGPVIVLSVVGGVLGRILAPTSVPSE